MTARRRARLALLPILMTAALCLSGCGALTDLSGLAHPNDHEEYFATAAKAAAGWVGVPVPAWLPSDSTDIHSRATNDETESVIALKSSEALPSWCVRTARRLLPFTSTSWAPEPASFPQRIERCGDYEVMRVDGGYEGWFTATKKGQKPEPGPTS